MSGTITLVNWSGTTAKMPAGACSRRASLAQHHQQPQQQRGLDSPSVSPTFQPALDDPEVQEAEEIVAYWHNDTPEEKRLVRKLDWRILPCTWLLFLLGFLDRANISNAYTGGLGRDFGLTDNQYSVIVICFFISYILFEVPANMLLTRLRPHILLPCLALLWGIFAALMGATKNGSQIAGIRFLLGFAEAGFAPGSAFYLSCWYRRYELATRYAILYTSVPLAGGLSGLLAGVITTYMDGTGGLSGWRWLFILEGLVSVFAAVIVFLCLPDFPSNSGHFLTEEESLLACNRLSVDGIATSQGAGTDPISHGDAFMMTVKDWRTWAQCLLFTLITGAQTMQYFIPTLVQSFGWTGAEAQYFTIPAYMAAVVYVVASCYLADKYTTKWPFILALSLLGFTLFLATILLTHHPTAQYILTVLAFGTIYGCSPLVKIWAADVLPQPAEKRAIALAIINSIGNSSSLYASWLWPARDAPRYVAGFATTTCWLGVCCVCTVVFARFFARWPVQGVDQAVVVARELKARRAAASSGGGREGLNGRRV